MLLIQAPALVPAPASARERKFHRARDGSWGAGVPGLKLQRRREGEEGGRDLGAQSSGLDAVAVSWGSGGGKVVESLATHERKGPVSVGSHLG